MQRGQVVYLLEVVYASSSAVLSPASFSLEDAIRRRTETLKPGTNPVPLAVNIYPAKVGVKLKEEK